MITPFNISILETDFAQLSRHGVEYGYGAKAEGGSDPRNGRRWNLRTTGKISTPISTIDNIDCSGYFRYAAYRATEGNLVVPDGSQNQLDFFDKLSHDKSSGVKKVAYRDAAAYMNYRRLFAAFIKPFTNGCGSVGHVFYLSQYDDGNNHTNAGTLESHGGAGCNSRPWNTSVLLREVYACFELPTTLSL